MDWTPDSKTVWDSVRDCYVYKDDVGTVHCVDLDTDLEVMTIDNAKQLEEDDDDFCLEDFTEDVSWMASNVTVESWSITEAGLKTSTRIRFKNRPVIV